MKVVIYCVVLSLAFSYACAVRGVLDEGQACLVQYLQQKAKLSSSFRSTLQPSSRCHLVIPITLQTLREFVTEEIKERTPGESDCLINEFDNQETLDELMKISVIHESKLLSEDEVKTQLTTTRNQLKNGLVNIALQCDTDDNNFISIFNEYLGIKNETLEVFQFEYCISKYVADNSLLAMDNIEVNPHEIDIKNVNCNNILEKERIKVENEIREKLTQTPNANQILECIIEAYKNEKFFDYGVALKVLYVLDFPKETKESEKARVGQKVASFALTTFNCVLSNSQL